MFKLVLKTCKPIYMPCIALYIPLLKSAFDTNLSLFLCWLETQHVEKMFSAMAHLFLCGLL